MRSLIALSAALLATTVLTGAASAATDAPRSKAGTTAKAERVLAARAAADEEEADTAPRGQGKAEHVEDDEDEAPRGKVKGKADRDDADEDDAPRGKGKGQADRGDDAEDDAPRGKGKGKSERVENDDEDDTPRGKRRVERLDDDEARELRYRWWKYRMQQRALQAPPAHWRWEYHRHLQMRALSRQPVGPYWAHRPYGRPYLP